MTDTILITKMPLEATQTSKKRFFILTPHLKSKIRKSKNPTSENPKSEIAKYVNPKSENPRAEPGPGGCVGGGARLSSQNIRKFRFSKSRFAHGLVDRMTNAPGC